MRAIKQIRIKQKNISPYFQLVERKVQFGANATIVKVLAFSIDPVMRVWLSGAKTNYRQVSSGDIFNCFGLGIIQKSIHQDYPVGQYVFGNTGTVNYFELDEGRQKQCFIIDKELVNMFGPYNFVYLINNGLAAYAGLQILDIKQGENVVVSTAAGATGLLLCHLLKKCKANIIAISSSAKQTYLKQFTSHFIDYRDRKNMIKQLRKIKFTKYFDNVGESQLDIALSTIQNNGILALCGAIQHYVNPKEGGITNYSVIISKRLKLEGVNFSHYFPMAKQVFQQFKDAKLTVLVTKIDQFIPSFLELFKSGGTIVGKIIIDPHQ